MYAYLYTLVPQDYKVHFGGSWRMHVRELQKVQLYLGAVGSCFGTAEAWTIET